MPVTVPAGAVVAADAGAADEAAADAVVSASDETAPGAVDSDDTAVEESAVAVNTVAVAVTSVAELTAVCSATCGVMVPGTAAGSFRLSLTSRKIAAPSAASASASTPNITTGTDCFFFRLW